MYGLTLGGMTTLFHLFVRHPILVLVLGLTGFANLIASNPGVGDRYGTDGWLAHYEKRIVQEHPELANQAMGLRTQFDALGAQPTGDQVRQVLEVTDAATDPDPGDVLANDTDRREAGFMLYLDAYHRDGMKAANQLFNKHGTPQKK